MSLSSGSHTKKRKRGKSPQSNAVVYPTSNWIHIPGKGVVQFIPVQRQDIPRAESKMPLSLQNPDELERRDALATIAKKQHDDDNDDYVSDDESDDDRDYYPQVTRTKADGVLHSSYYNVLGNGHIFAAYITQHREKNGRNGVPFYRNKKIKLDTPIHPYTDSYSGELPKNYFASYEQITHAIKNAYGQFNAENGFGKTVIPKINGLAVADESIEIYESPKPNIYNTEYLPPGTPKTETCTIFDNGVLCVSIALIGTVVGTAAAAAAAGFLGGKRKTRKMNRRRQLTRRRHRR